MPHEIDEWDAAAPEAETVGTDRSRPVDRSRARGHQKDDARHGSVRQAIPGGDTAASRSPMDGGDGDRDAELEVLERRFDAAMMEIYERAGGEVGYWATRYLQMLRARGGLGTARRLLNARATSDGYARLRDAGRLDLTVEAYALRPEFEALFTAEELNLARDRLEYFGRPVEASDSTSRQEPTPATDPEWDRLLEEAAKAPADHRIDYRDQVAAFGVAAIQAMERWAENGRSPGAAPRRRRRGSTSR